MPDLWVNANAEVPLGPIDQHDNVNSREVFGGHRLSGTLSILRLLTLYLIETPFDAFEKSCI